MKSTSVRYLIAVAAGKGGVGKSTLAVQLACGLKKRGLKVGLLDADVYGPSIEQMLPSSVAPKQSMQDPEGIVPAVHKGIPIITTAHFGGRGEATLVRAPIANGLIDQFLNRVEWGELDFLIVDFPPGTGDVQLTLLQKAGFSAAVLITTPQEVALLDVRKAAALFKRMQVPLLGVVENMSYFEDERETRYFPFGQGGGERLAEELETELLGKIPLDPALSISADRGVSLEEWAPQTPSAQVLEEIIDKFLLSLSKLPDEIFSIERLADGKIRCNQVEYTASDLQMRCPCARCKGVGESAPEVAIMQFQQMGRYAVRFQFSSGCSQGIYPFELLQGLGCK